MNSLIRQVTVRPQTTVRVCLLVYMAFCTYVMPFSRRCLQAWLWSVHLLDRDNMNIRITIPAKVSTSLFWCTNMEHVCVSPFRYTHTNTNIVSDTYLTG